MKPNEDYTRMATQASADEQVAYQLLASALASSPVPPSEILANLALYLPRSAVAHVLFMTDLYRRILNVHGVVVEFGNRWGRNLALFHNLRNVFEPHNYGRRIVGFDTFAGFPCVSAEDGRDHAVQAGALAVAPDYRAHLEALLALHERLSPRPGLRRFELVEGDAEVTAPAWFEAHPEVIVALAYFDMDLYRPTRAALQAVLPRLVEGSILGFDELCLREFPGETVALREVIDIGRHGLVRSPYSGNQSFILWRGEA